MPEPLPMRPLAPPQPSPPQLLCAAADLVERGKAIVFDVLLWGRPARAFALRFDGALVAYINRCVHVPTEMDWQPGEFLDHDKRWIVCSIHGASYEPADGRCVGGPCGRGKLMPITITEQDGQAHWYPSADIRPVATDAPAVHPQRPSPAL
jgi:nitrite reductase/ring-hydroxylating ferredoxin subunit